MYCHPKLSSCVSNCKACADPCSSCGATRMDLYQIPGDNLSVPMLSMKHFLTAMEGATKSVAIDELTEFIKWTAEFGEEGV